MRPWGRKTQVRPIGLNPAPNADPGGKVRWKGISSHFLSLQRALAVCVPSAVGSGGENTTAGTTSAVYSRLMPGDDAIMRVKRATTTAVFTPGVLPRMPHIGEWVPRPNQSSTPCSIGRGTYSDSGAVICADAGAAGIARATRAARRVADRRIRTSR